MDVLLLLEVSRLSISWLMNMEKFLRLSITAYSKNESERRLNFFDISQSSGTSDVT